MYCTVYTYASYNDKFRIAVCGYIIFFGDKIFQKKADLLFDIPTCFDAELHSIILGISEAFLLKNISVINLKTDCLPLIFGIQNKNKRKEKSISRYKVIDEVVEIINEFEVILRITHVKAHSGNEKNSMVDRMCRDRLRRHIKKHYLL